MNRKISSSSTAARTFGDCGAVGATASNRKYFVDNLRWATVFLLLPFHTFMIYNTYGEANYIKGTDNIFLININISFWPWFMPLLFTLAGISARYALTERKPIEYFKERLNKLFIPLLSGILLIIPGMTYFADRFHNDYTGNYFQHYVVFFTKWTDLTGYDGGFSPGHLWFILYLLVISIIAFPLIMIYNKIGKKYNWGKINFCILGSFFIFPCIGQLILDINGKSVGEYFFWYIIGYFILSNDIIITKCKKYYLFLSIISIIGMIFILIIFNINLYDSNIIYDMAEKLYAYISILALLGISKRKFDFSNKITDYFSKSSFAVYLFHLIWITIIAFYTVKVIKNIMIQVFVILLFSIILTFITYELLKRFKVTRIMFCLKK